MKKHLFLLLACLLAVQTWAYDLLENQVYYLIYNNGNEVHVSGNDNATGDIVIPETVTIEDKTYPVTVIEPSAFKDCGITSIVIPNSVTKIGDHAFRGCSALKTVTIGSGVTFIDGDAFFSTPALEDVYCYADPNTLEWDERDRDDFNPEGKTVIHVADAAAWHAKFSAVVNAIFRDGTTTPVSWAYNEATHTLTVSGTEPMNNYKGVVRPWSQYLDDITTVVISDGVTSIGSMAFEGCTHLTSVVIPNSVTAIMENAFMNCRKLESVTLPQNLKHLGYCAFAVTGLTSVTVPCNLTYGNVFGSCENLTTVTLGSKVDAFNGLTVADSPLLAVNVEAGNTTFKSIDGNIYSLLDDSFVYYAAGKSATTFTIPDGVKAISHLAFQSCNNLKSIVIPNSVMTIDGEAFSYCQNLESITFGTGTTDVTPYLFNYCNKLNELLVAEGHQTYKSIDGIIYSADGKTLVLCPLGKTSVNIAATTTVIGPSAFRYCGALTSVVIPDGLITISEDAFWDCEALTSIDIPNTVTTIGASAVRNCSALKTVTIGRGVTKISSDAFFDDKAVSDIYCYADPNTLEWDERDRDDFMASEATICHVPSDVLATWQEKFGPIVNVTFVGDLPSSITAVSRESNSNTPLYDLQGHRVNSPKKGIYIQRGKKRMNH